MGRILTYTKLVRRLRYSGVILEEDISRLNLLRQKSDGEVIFPNLHYLELHDWPLTAVEATLLFAPRLHTISLIHIQVSTPQRHSRTKHWGRLANITQQQLCVQILRKQSNSLTVFRTSISVGIVYGYPHRCATPKKGLALEEPSACFAGLIHLVGSADARVEYLSHLAGAGDISCLQYDTSKSYVSNISRVEVRVASYDAR